MERKIQAIIIWLTTAVAVTLCCNQRVTFDPISSTACINSQFVRTLSLSSALECSMKCAENPICQAFTHHQSDAASTVCRHFVFDKCSKGVTDCGCTGPMMQVFVRRQVGLSPGLLCPTSYLKPGGTYLSSLCDVRYKLHDIADNWNVGKQKCDSEPGLTIMADVTSSTENTYVNYIKPSDVYGFFLSGKQIPGSSEPGKNNYYWSSCNTSVDPSLWVSSQPNNNGEEDVIAVFGPIGLWDTFVTGGNVPAVMCKCLSPF